MLHLWLNIHPLTIIFMQYSTYLESFILHIIGFIIIFIEHYNSANSKNMEVCFILVSVMLWILAKGRLHLSTSLQVCGWAQIDIYSCLFIASKEHVTLSSSFLVLQPPVTRVTSGWLVGPFPTVDVWRYVSTTCGALSVMMCGEPMMHWWFAGSWDSLAQVKTYQTDF